MRPIKEVKSKISTLLFIAFSGIILSLLLFSFSRKSEDKYIQSVFKQLAEDRIHAFNNAIIDCLQLTEVLSAFYDSSMQVERHEFSSFLKPVLLHYSSIQALEYIPRVPHSQRLAYKENAIRDGFADFEFTEKDTSGKMVRAGKRNEYFPVYFIEPFQGNEIALGFDLGSSPSRLEAMNQACNTGEITATERIVLVQENEKLFGFLLIKPLYAKNAPIDTVEDRQKNLTGFVLGVFRVGTLFESSLQQLNPTGINFSIYDRSAVGDQQLLYTHKSRIFSNNSSTEFEDISFEQRYNIYGTIQTANRKWEVICTPTAEFIEVRKTWQPWTILIIGLSITGYLCSMIWFFMKRTVIAQRYVEEISIAKQKQEELVLELQNALKEIRTLKGILPICASCKKIRDDKGYWNQIEKYIRDHSDAEFSHSICPECAKQLYPDLNIQK